MKKLGIGLFFAFLFLASIYAVMQGAIGKNLIRTLLTGALQQSGFEIHIDQIEGTLPHQIELKGVVIAGEHIYITADTLTLRPILWRLVKNEIAFTNVRAKKISFERKTPFDFEGQLQINKKKAFLRGQISDWTVSARLDLKKQRAAVSAANSLLKTQWQVQFDPSYQITTANMHIVSDRLLSASPLPIEGRLLANLSIARMENGYEWRGTWQVLDLTIEQTQMRSVKGSGNGTWSNQTIKGMIRVDAPPFAKASIDWQILPDWRIVGTNAIDIDNLQSLPIPNIYGKLHASAEWFLKEHLQALHFDITATDVYYGTFFAQKASLYSDLQDPFHTVSGLIDLEFEKARWNDLQIETVSLETSSAAENWAFRLFMEGEWKHPLEVHINGFWKDHFIADIENCNGTFFNRSFALSKPIHFEWTKDLFRLPDMEITMAGATVFAHIDRKGDRTDARFRCAHLPLDFLSLNPLDVSIKGTLNLEAMIYEDNNRLQGNLKALIEQMEMATLDATGMFEGHFDKDLLTLKGHLDVRNAPLLNLDVALPIRFAIWPFAAEFLPHKAAHGHIALNGHIEDFVDFLDFGPHRLEGECKCDLQLSNTLYRPLVKGTLHFANGLYENYYTGTQLHHITADCLAENSTVYLRSFTAEDLPGTGNLSATGELQLNQGDLYPFQLDAVFTHLKFVEIDLVNAVSDGKIHIEGNATSALAKGNVQITQSDLAIPDHIPRPLPDLQIVYINPIHPVPPPVTEYHPYPLYLDLQVTAPQAVTIAGRGLTSEWKGDFHLGGTYTALAAKGKLELLSGAFHFSNRSFQLTDGSLSLSGISHEMPYLNLSASTETHGISIIAQLKGPLDDPQITLQSIPPLPLSAIMSYLLFGQNLSEISGFQAMQLATSLASLAGSGPDVMESTRRSLGVDRLRVISDPTEEGGETVVLEVGKYVSKGVLVSFTQGAEDSSTDISVEVELGGNFVFQMQSDQSQEQGIFTLKWTLNL